MATQDIVIVIPVLGRPAKAQPVVDSIQAATTVPHRILFVCSPGDTAQTQACWDTGADVLVSDRRPGPGDYARKINLGYRQTNESFIFTGADDLAFHPGWDTAALALMSNPSIGVVGTQDLCNERVKRGEHSTHSLVRRTYADTHGTIDKPGMIYAECYPHEFVDDEFCQTAVSRKAFAFARDSIVEHLHPNCGKGETDKLYRAAPQRLSQGRRIYRNRRHRWDSKAHVRKAPVSVIVATYGDPSWKEMAATRALPSLDAQRQLIPAEVISHHGNSLAEARNEGAKLASSPWLCFLDADDELAPNFFNAMQRHLSVRRRAGLLNPSVQFIIDGRTKAPKLFAPRDLSHGNYLVIGTLIRTDLFWEAGGFDPQWEAWEDWALFRRIVALGGEIIRVPQAVYRAHWASEGRNNTVADPEGLRNRIQADFEEWSRSR